jgi:DNA-binding transcriptional MerR regulator
MEGPWTIVELTERAAQTLAATPSADDGTPPRPARANGRIRDVPNERLVRWYVTVGLVDPPLSRRGRVAQYGRRHLLQLVAVKRRQAEGRSLAEIQAELAGATDEALAAVARVPDARAGPEALPAAPARFWARRPGQPGPQAHAAGGTGPAVHAAAEGAGPPVHAAAKGVGPAVGAAAERAEPLTRAAAGEAGPAVYAAAGEAGPAVHAGVRRDRADHGADDSPGGLVHGVRLAPGVTLLLEGAGREPGPEDVTEIVNAARPLLAELASRRLRAPGPGHPPGDPGPSPDVANSPRGAGHDH